MAVLGFLPIFGVIIIQKGRYKYPEGRFPGISERSTVCREERIRILIYGLGFWSMMSDSI